MTLLGGDLLPLPETHMAAGAIPLSPKALLDQAEQLVSRAASGQNPAVRAHATAALTQIRAVKRALQLEAA